MDNLNHSRNKTPIPKLDQLLLFEDNFKEKEKKKSVQSNLTEPVCLLKLASVTKLKESTKKLMSLLEEIQSKTCTKNTNENNISDLIQSLPDTYSDPTIAKNVGQFALKKLEEQTKEFDGCYLEEEDDCSVYKKLVRKCYCLTNENYNDFVIHFNEDTKCFTNSFGEIIKNLRILKKFLYMGGEYSKRALMFLNEGLSESSHAERVGITQGCSYADMCNIFDDFSIVTTCIRWPCKRAFYGDYNTQALTANFLIKLAQLEEGRRYLNFNAKIINDLRKVLRKQVNHLQFETLETLNETINLMRPPVANVAIVNYYCKPGGEGLGLKTVNALIQHRNYMPLDEVFIHLDLLMNLCNTDTGKEELLKHLPSILKLFKCMLLEYDNSEMNIIITNILNNIISRHMVSSTNESDQVERKPRTAVTIAADTGTEPIKMKNMMSQIPLPHPKKYTKNINKSRTTFVSPTNKFRQPSKRKVNPLLESSKNLAIDKTKKIFGEDAKNKRPVIVVPVD